jgi:hypothetical protein
VTAALAPWRGALSAVAAVALLVALTLGGPALALAATPEPTRLVGNDPRSSGEGPGLVGQPLFAIGLVIAIAIAAVALTLAYVRLTGGRRSP